MHAGRKYTFFEFILWTRRDLYRLTILAVIPTILYHFCGFTFLSISWVPVALLGTAVSFIIGFKNNASYSRLWEARQIYGGIINISRAFGVMIRDFLESKDKSIEVKVIFYRHFAWLTALRFQLREPRAWENMDDPRNVEYSRNYHIAEKIDKLEEVLAKYLSADELSYVLTKKNKATQLMALQSSHINRLFASGNISDLQLQSLQNAITVFYDNQGKAERIKNFPYPRHFSSIATIMLNLFVFLVPYGLLNDFNKLGNGTLIEGYSIWLNIPFAILLTWVFNSLDVVGESSSNPFEGNANDVPITNISRTIEIDMRDMLDETDLPPAITPEHNILM
ncbi:multidrug transporter [Pedobacter sp. Leaf41]|uniref:bestrophin family protein n=1 Tax=Pedobacter sp. Leaf41 TaxID=1736218 RepID=UPI0007034547|nr:bestrophin family ion channel [Pedobacter sp. Leaf41]KQN36048.1 multidrug transporter [Pedobacter sp. Leaf41]